jgi:hypothetical protein
VTVTPAHSPALADAMAAQPADPSRRS